MGWKIFRLTQILGESTENVLSTVTVTLIKIKDYLKMEEKLHKNLSL